MKRILNLIFTIGALWCTVSLCGQVTFQKFYYGDNQGSEILGIKQTSDGGYLMVATWNYGFIDWPYVELIRTNGNGDTVWTRTFETSRYDFPVDLVITQDEGCCVYGYRHDSIGNGYFLFLSRFDSLGNNQWNMNFDVGGREYPGDLDTTNDGGFILSGHSDIPMQFLIKVDGAGGVVWEKNFVSDQTLLGGEVLCLTNGDLAGTYSVQDSTGLYFTVVYRTDAQGNVLWSNEYHSIYDFAGSRLAEQQNGDLVLMCWTRDTNWSNWCYSITTLTSFGVVMWSKIHVVNINWNFNARDIDVSGNGDVVICGNYWYQAEAIQFVTRISASGSFQAMNIFQSGPEIRPRKVLATQDGGSAIIGRIDTIVPSPFMDLHAYFFKTDQFMNSDCNANPIVPGQYNLLLTTNSVVMTATSACARTSFIVAPISQEFNVVEMCPVGVEDDRLEVAGNIFYSAEVLHVIDFENGSLICIYDITGKLVKRELINTLTQEIYCSDLACGVYTYTVFDSNSAGIAGKFVKE